MNMDHLKVAALSVALIGLGACVTPEDSIESVAIEPDKLEGHMRFLADDALGGRETASLGLYVSANYVASQFRSYGLEPGGDAGAYFQTVPLRQSARDPSGSVFRLHRNNDEIDLASGEDFFVSPAITSTESSVTGPVVFVGYGIHSPDQGFDDYAGLDVNGKIVAILGGRSRVSAQLDPHVTPRPSQAAEMNGAVGTITLTLPGVTADEGFATGAKPDRRPLTTWTDEEGQPFSSTRYTVGTEINATLSSAASARLLQGAERSYSDLVAEAQSGENPPLGFEIPLEVTIGQRSIHSAAESRNVLAILRGSDPELADEYVVITCHLDHVGIGGAVGGDSIYNGAMDNATGVAFMLEVARALAMAPDRPKRSILFYATTAEEHGLIGSSYFVNNPTVPLENIVANINVDAPRMFWPFDEITAFGAEHATLKTSIREAVESLGYTLDEGIRFESGASDHFSFLRAGVPGTRVIPAVRSSDPGIDAEEIMRMYRPHQPSDDLTLPFDYEIGAEFTSVIRTIVRRLADAEERPQWIKGDPLAR
jgi:hypothetical protein